MDRCKLFHCAYVHMKVCCASCDRTDCVDRCQNDPTKCGYYANAEKMAEERKQKASQYAKEYRQTHRKELAADAKRIRDTPKFEVGDRVVMRRADKFNPEDFNAKVCTVKFIQDGAYGLLTKGFHLKALKVGYVNAAYVKVEDL